MISQQQIELLQLTARFAVKICLDKYVDSMSADFCNLHELALAGLGYEDKFPQVPIEEIVLYVEKQLDGKFPPASGEVNEN